MFARFGAAAAVAAPAMKRSRTLRKRREAGRVFDFTKWGLVVQIAGADRFPGNSAAVMLRWACGLFPGELRFRSQDRPPVS